MTISINWPECKVLPDLLPDDVHIWAANLQRPSAQVEAMRLLLSQDERERADKFHVDKNRAAYMCGRGLLRILAGHYTKLRPDEIVFQYGEKGKPELADCPLKFNVSHTHGLALLALTWGREIGVDVEKIRPLSDAGRLAKRSFSDEEYQVWTVVAEPQKMQAFFNCWTRKEAFIKAIGEGLSCPLNSFSVTLRPDEPAQLLHVGGSQMEAARWQLQSLAPAPDFVGAVLVEGNDWNPKQFAWPG
jgi:4'-phosphopantetheinyl transferase